MVTIQNAIIRVDGITYDGVTIYTDGFGRYKPERHKLVISDCFYYDVSASGIKNRCSDFVPNLGDEIHIVQPCPLTTQDLRNNYIIKREFDDGVCNVFSGIPDYSTRLKFDFFLFDSVHKILVTRCYFPKNTPISKKAEECTAIIPEYAKEYLFQYYDEDITIYAYAVGDAYAKLLTGQVKNPCVYYENLRMNRNELTLDMLNMLYQAGIKPKTEEYRKNLELVLATISQYNWKEYPYSIYIITDMLASIYGIYGEVMKKPAKLGKAARELVVNSISLNNDVKEKDFNMIRDFLGQLLGITDVKFAPLAKLHEKLNSIGLSYYRFCDIFEVTTRIIPRKQWKEQK